jgi:hypothetical protein
MIYLPPGYDGTARSYPVVVLRDGQNVFSRRPFAGRLPGVLARFLDALDARDERSAGLGTRRRAGSDLATCLPAGRGVRVS